MASRVEKCASNISSSWYYISIGKKVVSFLMSNPYLIGHVVLRIVAAAATAAAMAFLLHSEQHAMKYGLAFVADFSASPGLRYLFLVVAGVCGSSFTSLMIVVLVYTFGRSKINAGGYFYLILHDAAMMALVLSGCASGTAIGMVALYGQKQAAWMPICRDTPKFCHKVTRALVLSYGAFFCYAILSFMTTYKLKSLAMKAGTTDGAK